MTDQELIRRALLARERAYTPYSHFQVGAALLTRTGTVYPGCNIENAAYTPTNCAERTAFFSAVFAGEREFEAIAIVGGPEGTDDHRFCPPCGICRQVMREFCDLDFKIYLENGEGRFFEASLEEMLPFSFSPADMNQ